MSNLTNSDSSSLVDLVTPETIGLFWITNSSLNRELKGFEEINYLFDGLISQFLFGQSVVEKRANIFFTDNFSKTLFLAHITAEGASKSEIAGDIDEQVALIQSNMQGRIKILILQDTTHDWAAELSKRYDQFTFIKIVL